MIQHREMYDKHIMSVQLIDMFITRFYNTESLIDLLSLTSLELFNAFSRFCIDCDIVDDKNMPISARMQYL